MVAHIPTSRTRRASIPSGLRRRSINIILPLVLTLRAIQFGRAQSSPATAPELPSVGVGSAQRGRDLFAGGVKLRNGGPPCASCHSLAGLPFPGGGTLGPDLTREYSKLGPAGTQTAMQTLYFPTMTPIYDRRPLTADEQADLMAFFQQSSDHAASARNTIIVIALGVAVFVVLLIVTGLVWRDRLTSVRGRLVALARQAGGAA